jgi:hypothetical protein
VNRFHASPIHSQRTPGAFTCCIRFAPIDLGD